MRFSSGLIAPLSQAWKNNPAWRPLIRQPFGVPFEFFRLHLFSFLRMFSGILVLFHSKGVLLSFFSGTSRGFWTFESSSLPSLDLSKDVLPPSPFLGISRVIVCHLMEGLPSGLEIPLLQNLQGPMGQEETGSRGISIPEGSPSIR